MWYKVNGYSEGCGVSKVVQDIYDLGAGGGVEREGGKRGRGELQNLLVIQDYLDWVLVEAQNPISDLKYIFLNS